MKKKNKIIILISLLVITIISLLLVFIFKNNNSNFTLEEKKWIEDNKNKVIDISILNDIPIINYNGKGLLFSFLDDLEEELGLKFNKTAYKIDDTVNTNYSFKLVEKNDNNDLLILEDNYVLITKNNLIYNNIKDINNLKIGILSSEKENILKLIDNSNELVEVDTNTDLINILNNEEQNVDGIIILKSLIMEKLIKDELTISYQFENYTADYVINLNGDEILNNIIRKYYNNWEKDNYKNEYNKYLLEHYYSFKDIKDNDQTNVKSRKYVYGFIENGIYDSLKGSKLKGINNLILKNFSDFSSVSISYKEYKNISDLINDYKNNKVDIFLNNTSYNDFNDSKITKSGINSKLVVISKNNNKSVIKSISDLEGKKIATIDSNIVESYFKDSNINFVKYKNINELIKKNTKDELIIIDLDNYNYYKNDSLEDYKIDYILDIDNNYKYVINGQEKVLADLFDFYLNYTSTDYIIADGYDSIAYKSINYFYVLIIVVLILIITLILILINKIKRLLIERKKQKRINLSKSDKLKFIDQLTSLKNRAYLNSKIDSWDNSELYPQSIIILDLNNISTINDNYGREEGDKVIVEAASILINTQLPNTEIIRTDGDEFLIYLVGYSEKNVISYLRNLSREMKKLSHGYGSAAGYSMINDGIKTIDDAVNEATIDMKNNKEDIDY